MQKEKTTQEIIDEQMNKIPKEVKEAIISVDYETKLQEITKRQKLLIDQAAKLEIETSLVLLGLEPISTYISNLQNNLGISIIRAQDVAMDVNENIFKKIRQYLEEMDINTLSVEDDPELNKSNIEIEKEEFIRTDEERSNLDRNQILNEIEDPSSIGKEIETLAEVPYQQDIKIKTVESEKVEPKPSLLETKMAGMTITSQQIIDAVPETKLPPIEKKRPFSGVDPYREEIK